MLLSHKTSVKLNENYSNIVGHMCYAVYKLWNVCKVAAQKTVLVSWTHPGFTGVKACAQMLGNSITE